MESSRYREKGLSLYKKARYAEALDCLYAEKKDPAEDPELAYFMGLCCVRMGKNDEAVQLFNQVIDSETHLGRLYQARMIIAWILIDQGALKDAELQLGQVIDAGYQSPQTWSALGHCQYVRGNKTAALESYRKALDLDGGNPNAANGLGYLMAETGDELDRAIVLCRQAVSINPDNAAYYDSLGWALFQAGRHKEAVPYLIQAQSKSPEDKVIEDHLKTVRTHELSVNN